MATSKEDRSFKTLINRETTDSNKFFFNEFGADTINVYNGDIWVSNVPFDDPAQGIVEGTVEERTFFVLTEDLSVPGSQSWKAEELGDRLRDWISPKFGVAYEVSLYDSSNNEIFTTDPSNWFFDYQTGILTFSGSVAAFPKPFKISGYRYIGVKGSTSLSETGTEEPLAISLDPTNGGDPTFILTVAKTQAEIDAIQASLPSNSFATLAGIRSILPNIVNYDITVTIPDGAYSLSAGDLGDWTKVQIDKTATIIVRSTGITEPVPGTSTYSVLSADGIQFVLDPDPGWGADARQGDFARVDVGANAGKYASVIKHVDGVTYQFAGQQEVQASDTISFRRPSVQFTLTEDCFMVGPLDKALDRFVTTASPPHFFFRGIEFNDPTGTYSLTVTGTFLQVELCRFVCGNPNLHIIDTFLLVSNAVVFDGTYGSPTALYAESESKVRTLSTDDSIAFMNSVFLIWLFKRAEASVFDAGFADATVAIQVYNESSLLEVGPSDNYKVANVGTVVKAVNGASVLGSTSGTWTTMPSGGTSDIILDTEAFTWDELETHKSLEGGLGSRFFEVTF